MLPRIIYSDNGTNLKSADKEIQALYANWDKVKIAETMALRKIDWKYSPPAASHQNGATEIVFKQVRKCLQTMVGQAKIKDEAFRNVVAEIGAILNSRPLCALSTDAKDMKVLTPNMLLGGSVNAFLPPNDFDTADYLRNSWKHAQGVVNAFWKRWIKEYLHTLTLRQKWFTVQRNLQVDDIVLIVDDTAKRNLWPLGVIVDTHADSHGHVRRVSVRKASGVVLQRDVRKICLLEASDKFSPQPK